VATAHFAWNLELNANWKVCKDAFQEVSHVFSLHRRSTGDLFTSKSNPYLRAHELALFGHHGRMSVPANLDWQPIAVEALARRYGILTLQKQGASFEGLPEGINPTRVSDWSFSAFICFPNCCMFVPPGVFFNAYFLAAVRNRTRWEARIYFPKDTNLAEHFSQ
jgi:hypothetical protein